MHVQLARNKAVANGTMSFYIDHQVIAHVLSFDYDADCDVLFEANNPEHVDRTRPGLSAPEYLGRYFDIILPKINPTFHNPYMNFMILVDAGYSHRGSTRVLS
jgi:hypothetical protein